MTSLSKEEFFLRYDIDIRDGRLGGGAFGTVYKAWDNLRDEWKAVKIAEVKVINGKEFSLISEFDATKRLPIHKNIINYESVHTFAMPNGMFDYAVMQYYPQGNLKQLVSNKDLESVHIEELIIGLFRGLEVLHKHGVKHRDLKPSNILISERKGHFTPKIADFGLAKYTNDGDLSAVTNSFGGGTLEYSSPEQLLGEPLRDNTDLWAVGVIAFELFLGHIPFIASDASSRPEVKRRIISQNIVNAPLPPEIEKCPIPYIEVITKCLIKDPEKRIKSASEVLGIINQYKTSQKVEINPVAVKATEDDEGTVIVSVGEQLQLIDKINEADKSELSHEKETIENKDLVTEDERIKLEKDQAKLEKQKEDQLKKEKLELAKREAEKARQKKEQQAEADRLEREAEAERQQQIILAKEKSEKEALIAEKAKSDEEKRKKDKQVKANRLKREREEAKRKKAEALISKKAKAKKQKEQGNRKANKNKKQTNEAKPNKAEITKRIATPNRQEPKATPSILSKYRKQIVAALFLLSIGTFVGIQYFGEEPVSVIGSNENEAVEEEHKETKPQYRDQIANAKSIDELLTLEKLDASIAYDDLYKSRKAVLLSIRDNEEWNDAKETNTIESYSDYVEANQLGNYIDEANAKIKTLIDNQLLESGNSEEEMYLSAKQSGQIAQLQYYVEKFPDGKYTKSAKSELVDLKQNQRNLEWNATVQRNTIGGYQTIIDKYPTLEIAQLARLAQAKLVSNQFANDWEAIKATEDSQKLLDFERRHPNSKFANQVRERLDVIKTEKLFRDRVNQLLEKGSIEELEALSKSKDDYKRAEIKTRIKQLKKESLPKTDVENEEVKSGNTPASRIVNAIAGNMIKISGGNFFLGCKKQCDNDNSPAIEVTVDEFYLSKYEVTQEEYEAVMGTNPSTYNDCKECPVENVSYYDAQKFIDKINGTYGTSYRLPTEEEWEYAAKAGSEYKYSGGNDIIQVGVYRSNSNNGTQRAGSKNQNDFGLYDMTGNVHEWCNSLYSKDGYGSEKETTNEKIIRGGSWRSKSSDCRVDSRNKNMASIRNGWTGFRLAKG